MNLSHLILAKVADIGDGVVLCATYRSPQSTNQDSGFIGRLHIVLSNSSGS